MQCGVEKAVFKHEAEIFTNEVIEICSPIFHLKRAEGLNTASLFMINDQREPGITSMPRRHYSSSIHIDY